jgi:hypothetical protein
LKSSLKHLQIEFQAIIPREKSELVLRARDISRFWSLFDNLVREIKEEYVKKIPNGGTPSDNIVRAMAIGRIAALEEALGEKPAQA